MSEPVGNTPRSVIPGNSHKQRDAEPPKETREPVQKIVSGKVVTRKPNIFKRMGRSMVADDVNNVGDYVVAEVFVPAIRNLIYDIISQGSHRVLFGTARGRRGSSGVNAGGPVSSLKTAYHRVANEPEPVRNTSREGQARHNFDDIILDDRAEAIDVLESLIARVERYGSASVADFYDFLGVSGGFPDQAYGWRSLDGADVRQTRRGFIFELPRPILLKQ